jgi:signal transduction histidine kinase
MKLFQNHRHLLFFIGSSLVLLAAVEFLWLRKLYNEGKDGIREDIEMRLKDNATKLQIVYMQNMGTHLVDSFMEQVEKKKLNDAKEVQVLSKIKRVNGKIDVEDFIKQSQKTYLSKLDTLSNLQLGTAQDKAVIDEFLNKMRKDYGRRLVFVNSKPQNDKDSMLKVVSFLKEQKRAYTSLWYLYRLGYSPQFNRPLMDSFFTELRKHTVEEQKFNMLSWKADLNHEFTSKWSNKPSQNIRIFIKSGTNKKYSNAKDSLLGMQAYEFERFVSSQINPQDVKHVLDSVFDGSGLTFVTYRLDAEEMVPKQGNAIVATTQGGRKVDSYKNEKIAVAAYNYPSLILSKMKSEIGFALFVWALVALSFWLIYHSFLQQKRLIALKNDFINNMTHELKTPITTVGVAIEAITNFGALNNPEQTKEYLDISKNELNRLSLMVDKVLKMAVFENAEAKLSIETIDIGDITQEVINSMRLQCDKYNATIQLNRIGEDFTVNADKVHITSVIYNLIDNALKYGGEKPDITIDIQPFYNDFMRLSISDKGVGIPPQYQEKIFEKFFRVPTGDVHTVKGHGLGLNYVKNVIEQHGGKLHIDSAEGKGSTFSVFLPLPDNQN